MTKVKLLVIHLCKITTHYCKCNIYFSFSSSTTWIKENAINLSQRNNYDKNKQTTKSRFKKLLYGELGQKKAKMRSRSGLRLSVLSWCFLWIFTKSIFQVASLRLCMLRSFLQFFASLYGEMGVLAPGFDPEWVVLFGTRQSHCACAAHYTWALKHIHTLVIEDGLYLRYQF